MWPSERDLQPPKRYHPWVENRRFREHSTDSELTTHTSISLQNSSRESYNKEFPYPLSGSEVTQAANGPGLLCCLLL